MPSPLLRSLLCCVLFLVPATGLAQAQKERDQAELQHYTLTMEKATRYSEIFEDLKALAKAHPELKDSLSGESTESLDALEHRIASQPLVVGVLEKHNFTPRDFVVFGLALFQAAFAEAAAKENGVDPARAAAEAHVNPANLRFVAEHKAELEALMTGIKNSSDESSGSN